jgi:hypothetical protein
VGIAPPSRFGTVNRVFCQRRSRQARGRLQTILIAGKIFGDQWFTKKQESRFLPSN